MARVLLVEDEERLARSLLVGLRDEGYVVEHTVNGEEGLQRARDGTFDAIVLDLRLPRMSGEEVCRRLRACGNATPILILTACDQVPQIVSGLDLGADDYLTKPFDFDELLARLRALLRRGSAGTGAVLHIADVEVDTASRRVRRGEEAVTLNRQEYQLLELLLLNVDVVVSRSRIASALWEDELGPESNAIEVLISNLRRKIDGDRASSLVHTLRGEGYMLSEGRQ